MSKHAPKSLRWDASAPVRPIAVTRRDLDFLYKAFVHGPLSTAMLRALVSPNVTQPAVTNRLRKLKQPPQALLRQPGKQRRKVNANASSLILEIAPKGVELLLERGRVTEQQARWHEGITGSNRAWFEHQAMTAHLTASMELACMAKGMRFISWLDIFSHPRCPQSTKDMRRPIAITYSVDDADRATIPDALCGVESADGFSFFAVEADRGNEPTRHPKSAIRRASVANHVHEYRYVIRNDLHRKHYGIPNMTVLIVTVSDMRVRRVVEMIEEATRKPDKGLAGSEPFLVKGIPEFAPLSDKQPPVSGIMLETPFKRVGAERVFLCQ